MSLNQASPPISSETEEAQIKTPQQQRPKLHLSKSPLFASAFKGLGQKNIIQARRDAFADRDLFITESRKRANSHVITAENCSSISTNNVNGQSSRNSTDSNSPLEICNQKANVKNNPVKDEEIKLVHAQSNISNFSAYPTSIKDEMKRNPERYKTGVNNVNVRTQKEWKGDKKLNSNSNKGNWNAKISTATESATSYPHSISTSSLQPSSVSNITKKLDEKEQDTDNRVNKPKDEDSGVGRSKIDYEDSKKGSFNIEDGWGPIDENGDDSWDTVNCTDTSDASSKLLNSEKKYDHPSQPVTSSQSVALTDRVTQNSNDRRNCQRSASTTFVETSFSGGRTRQDTADCQYNSKSCSQLASVRGKTKQNFNNKERGQEFTYSRPKTELEKDKKENSKTNDQGGEDVKSGWPKLDLDKDRRNSYDNVGSRDDENSLKENKNERSGNRIFQRSISTPFAQYSKFENHNNSGASNRNHNIHHNDNGRGDCSVSLPHSVSSVEERKNWPPKSQFTRSSSFRDGANRKPNCQTNPNCTDQRNFDKRSQGSKMSDNGCSNSNTNATDWKRAWRGNDYKMDANRDVDFNSEQKMSESINQIPLYIDKPNKSDSILHKENSLKDEVQEADSGDEWSTTSETSEVSGIVLENDSSKNVEDKRVVENNSDKLTITLHINGPPKEDNDLGDSRTIEDTSKSSSVVYKEIDEDILPFTYLDPLEDSFFMNCSAPVIPPPRPATADVVPVHNLQASNAACLVGVKTSESSDRSIFTEVDPIESPGRCEVLENIPDARQIQEITSFLKELEAEKSMPIEISEKIFKDVIKVINYHVKGYCVYLFGSYVSELAVSTSNLNLALKSDSPPRNSFLLQLQKALSRGLNGYQVEPFDEDKNAKKSKICFSEPKTGITCELGYFGSSVSNYRKMNLLLRAVCQFDPRIKTLLIVTRIWAEVCLIDEPEEGKLHAMGYSLLMLHFLQELEKPLLPIVEVNMSSKNWSLNPLKMKNESSVGELWLSFLKYYSGAFRWDEDVVTIHCKDAVMKSSKAWERSWIAIEDPFTQKNIADSVVTHECAEGIFSCFKATYQYFSTPVDYEDSDSSDNGSQNNSSKKEFFSFNDITFDQNLHSFCEICDELNEPCGKCRPSKEVILQPLPALSDLSLACVNTALHDVYKEFILPDGKIEGRKAFVRDLESSVKHIYPTAKLTLFGSSVNAFGFNRSDLDICMTLSRKPGSNIEKAGILRNLVRYLRKKPQFYENIYGLYHAKIPIVKFHYIPEDWYCDLSLYNVLAVHNSKLLCKYGLFDERCRILGCAMKLLAKKAVLDDTRCLSSYSYILTVIHYLQQVEPPVLPVLPLDDKKVFDEQLVVPKDILEGRNYWLYENIDKLKKRYLPHPKNVSSVGELWLGLLDFYARYDGTNAVTITQKEPLPSSTLRRCARLLNIEDPFLEKDNLGCILNDTRADQTRKVLGRARLLFGKEIHKDWRDNPKKFFFSSSNLTGQFIKDVECFGCGGFGHEKSDCLKADPFKKSKFRNKFPKPRRHPYIRKV